jgi:WD40 repeat protein
VWNLASDGPGALAAEGANARVFFSAENDVFASRDEDCSRWRLTSGKDAASAPRIEQLALPMPEGYTSLCLASNQLAFTAECGTCLIPLADAGLAKADWVRTAEGISGASPDGRWLAIFQPYTRWLHVYRLPGLETATTLTNRASIASFEFSPRGDELAAASSKRVEVWQTATWAHLRELTNAVGLLYAPDGRTCWLTKDYRTAGLYDADTMQPLLPLPSGTLPLAVSPDGRYLDASLDARRLQVWDLLEVRARIRELGLDWGGLSGTQDCLQINTLT